MNPASLWSIHIASRDHAALLFDALRSVDQQTVKDVQMIFVDQSMASESGLRLQSERPDVIVLRNFRDRGYTRAHNQAIAFALSRWPAGVLDNRFVLFLHPDAVLESRCLEQMQRAFESDPSLMLAGPKIIKMNLINSNGRIIKCIENPSKKTNISDLPKGFYIVEVYCENTDVLRQKIIK